MTTGTQHDKANSEVRGVWMLLMLNVEVAAFKFENRNAMANNGSIFFWTLYPRSAMY